ncbi:MAG TPA: 30S ribosomal protein S5 [Candidatus Rifleibacterium sp.]|nr:30S ribosomal protein S5 [Candidatus Rifleibacterium sp.]HPT46864.1 30S ribosomal protein S5 [Candidatus Rifleibacterium sp.]
MAEQGNQGNPRFRRDGGRRRDQVVENEFTEKIISVNRVSKTVKGGRHFGFSVLVCVGDQKGKVGIAIGKAKAVPDAVRKGLEKARKMMVQIPLNKDTIAHPFIGKFGSSQVLIKPAAPGTGVIAGGAVRAIFEALGVKDVLSKRLGSKNPVNMAKATMNALRDMRGVDVIAKNRGITPGQVING